MNMIREKTIANIFYVSTYVPMYEHLCYPTSNIISLFHFAPSLLLPFVPLLAAATLLASL